MRSSSPHTHSGMPPSSPSIAPAASWSYAGSESMPATHCMTSRRPRRVSMRVRRLQEILEPRRVKWKFFWPEVTEADVTGIELGKERSESREVRRVGIGSDVEVFRRANHAVPVDREAADDE